MQGCRGSVVALLAGLFMACLTGPASAQVSFSFTPIDVPAAMGSDTQPGGVNNAGHVSGGYVTPSGDLAGFFYDGVTFADVTVPGSGGAASTAFGPINYTGYLNNLSNSGDAVGVYNNADGVIHGFLRAAVGTITPLPDPVVGTTVNFPLGINNAGDIVGYFTTDPLAEMERAFFLSGGVYTELFYPGAVATNAQGINDLGQIVGIWFDATDTPHGFLLDGGAFSSIDFPGADATYVSAINNVGQMTGAYVLGDVLHGFYRDQNGVFTSLDYPGAGDTAAFSINDSGALAGVYDGFTRGFVAQVTAPEAPSLPLLGLGLCVLGAVLLRARRTLA